MPFPAGAASLRPGSLGETEACFIVRDHNGQALAYIYFDKEKGRRAARDDARSIAADIAKLPEGNPLGSGRPIRGGFW